MKQTILSVDDEPHMLKLLERIITEKTPYHVTTTSNSLEVPELLKQNTYDLILTDLKMPGLDGMDILLASGQTIHFQLFNLVGRAAARFFRQALGPERVRLIPGG